MPTFKLNTEPLREEGKLVTEAARELLRKSSTGVSGVGESMRRVGVVFKEGTTSNKLAVLGGISTGVTFALTGLRTLRTALQKDEKTGKRDYASAALGTAELVGGGFLTALFWQRLQMAGKSIIDEKENGGQCR